MDAPRGAQIAPPVNEFHTREQSLLEVRMAQKVLKGRELISTSIKRNRQRTSFSVFQTKPNLESRELFKMNSKIHQWSYFYKKRERIPARKEGGIRTKREYPQKKKKRHFQRGIRMRGNVLSILFIFTKIPEMIPSLYKCLNKDRMMHSHICATPRKKNVALISVEIGAGAVNTSFGLQDTYNVRLTVL